MGENVCFHVGLGAARVGIKAMLDLIECMPQAESTADLFRLATMSASARRQLTGRYLTSGVYVERAHADCLVPCTSLHPEHMNPVLRNILVVLAGVVVGSVVNMALVNTGPYVVPLPEGADISTLEGLRDGMASFTPLNFLFPFLGHALGTLVGAFFVAKFAASRHFPLAMGVGAFFLVGGIAAVNMFGGPLWFKVTDLLLAYIPMAWLGASVAGRTRPRSA